MFLKDQKISLASILFLSTFGVIWEFDESLAWPTSNQVPWMLIFVTKNIRGKVQFAASRAKVRENATIMFDCGKKNCEFHYVKSDDFLP